MELLSHDELVALSARARAGDLDARNQIVMANQGLVISAARRFLRSGLPWDDLIGEANVGLIVATDRYDSSFKTAFATYANYWINQRILMAIQDASGTGISVVAVDRIKEIARATDRLIASGVESPTFDDAATEARLSDTRKQTARRALRGRVPMSLEDLTGYEACKPDRSDEDDEMNAFALEMADSIAEPQRTILRLRYGIDEDGPLCYREIAKRVGVCREMCRILEAAAISELRTIVESSRFSSDIPPGRPWKVRHRVVTDDEWNDVSPMVPPVKPGGRPRKVDMRSVVDGMLYRQSTGCTWKELPPCYPEHFNMAKYWHEWSKDGTWSRIHESIRKTRRRRDGEGVSRCG